MDNITELHHVVDLPPAVLADPAVPAAAISVEARADDVEAAVVRRSDPVVLILAILPPLVPVVRRHHAGEA
ncbi:hypothetical protein T11_4944, partial [Trichinella zimbabwensis]